MMSSVGPVTLRMSTGVYTGTCHFFLVEGTHRELVIAGPAATATIELESGAEAGEILLSERTASALPPGWVGPSRGDGRLLLELPDRDVAEHLEPSSRELSDEIELYVPEPLRAHLLLEAGEAEHRQVTAAFLKFTGVDGEIAANGAEACIRPSVDARRAPRRRAQGAGADVVRIGHRRGRRQDLHRRRGALVHRRRRGAHVACPPVGSRDVRRVDVARRRQPRPGVLRRHRHRVLPVVQRHGRHDQPRGAAHLARRSRRPADHRRCAGTRPHALRDHLAVPPPEGKGTPDHGLQRRRRPR